MYNDVKEDIKKLEYEILQIEDNIIEFLRLHNDELIEKSLHNLESSLRYLSILANGAPISKNDDRKIMDFLRTHYDYLKKLSVPA